MLTVNGIRVLSAKISIPWRGVWTAYLNIDSPKQPLTGAATILIDTTGEKLVGFIDPTATGTFTYQTRLCVVGGLANGWSKTVDPKHFHSAAGLSSAMVTIPTGASVGETVIESAPLTWGPDFMLYQGPAVRVFEGRDWYIDPGTGNTIAAAWPTTTLPQGAILQDWDPTHMRASLSSFGLLLPGTTLVDDRFNGVTQTVRDVELNFDASGATITATCSNNPVNRMREAMTTLIRELGGLAYVKNYRYRYVLGADNNLALQAISPGAPDINPIQQWSGFAGTVTGYAPGTEIVVGFTGDSPPSPFISAVAPNANPISQTVTTSGPLKLGDTAAVPLAKASGVVTLLTALQTFMAAAATATTAAQIATAAGTFVSNCGPLVVPPATIPTTKVMGS